MELPLPRIHELTLNWIMFFAAGAIVGHEMRKVVFSADPLLPLVAVDWGILVGAGVFYLTKYLRNHD